MGCHTWGYKKVKSMKQKDFDDIKAYCDIYADKVLSNPITAEEMYNLSKRCKINVTLEHEKSFLERKKKEAQYYKDNIEKDRTLIRYYTNTIEIDNELYVTYESCLDWYIRVNSYPEGVFKSAEEIIKLCEKDNWEFAYWFDNETGKIVRAQSNVSEAKERIKQMFKDDPNIVVEFG